MAQGGAKGRGRGRVGRAAHAPTSGCIGLAQVSTSIGRASQSRPGIRTLRDKGDLLLDDSTQPPDVGFSEIMDPGDKTQTSLGGDGNSTRHLTPVARGARGRGGRTSQAPTSGGVTQVSTSIGRSPQSQPGIRTLRDEADSLLDNSTQPPDVGFSEIMDPCGKTHTSLGGDGTGNSTRHLTRMTQGPKGRGRERGGRTAQAPTSGRAAQVSTSIGRAPQSQPDVRTLRDEADSSSNDSTQSLDVGFSEFMDPGRETHTILGGDVSPTRKRGRGPAKCTEFERLRKLGPIPLKIKNGETAPSCGHATVFTTRVTWIVKHHANMGHASWIDLDEAEKDELINCVRADFVLDWAKRNHRETVTKQLRKRYNAFRYQLHKIYLGYATHEDALAKGTVLVDTSVWAKLCERWASEGFKKLSNQNKANRKKQRVNHTAGRKSFVRLMEEKCETATNLVDFYKEVRWSKKKGAFVTSTAEVLYNQMVEKLNEIEPEDRTKDAAASVFKEVLGHRSGYARGLGGSVIPELSSSLQSAQVAHLADENERHKNEAQYYKSQFEELKGVVEGILARQNEYEQRVDVFMLEMQSQRESQRDTLGWTSRRKRS